MTDDTQPLMRDLLDEMRSGFARIDERAERMETELHAFRTETGERLLRIEKRLAAVEDSFRGMLDDWTELRAKQRDLERRTVDLERRAE